MTVLIKGGTVVNADRTFNADVLCSDGKIVSIGDNMEAPAGATVVDAGGQFVMPGGIDPHTHMQLPFMGTVTTEDFYTGTAAGLAGGTTMVVDFALPSPGQGLHDALQMWDNKSTRAHCDYSFHMAVTWWSEQVFNEMEKVVKERGITTFKHFMAYKGALMVEDDEMFASFKRCAELGALPLVHAENGDIVQELQQKYFAEGITGPEGHAYSRPPEVEGLQLAARYLPALEVGGDFYDFLQLPDGRVGLLVGDVSGKGVPAALFMARFSSDFCAAALAGATPAEIAAAVPPLLPPANVVGSNGLPTDP
mgnify:CR=1 FL=1